MVFLLIKVVAREALLACASLRQRRGGLETLGVGRSAGVSAAAQILEDLKAAPGLAPVALARLEDVARTALSFQSSEGWKTGEPPACGTTFYMSCANEWMETGGTCLE